jgi:hypothetical protein
MTAHRRTWQQQQTGHLMITVGLEPAAADLSIEHHRRLADFTKKLLEVFAAKRLPATWAVRDPAHSPACPPVLRATGAHEIAIQADDSWLGPQAGRTRFARELSQRVTQARHSNIRVSSLVTPTAPKREDFDLIVKHGISAITGVANQNAPRRPQATPRSMHFGVWELPASERLPLPSRWFSNGNWALSKQIRQAASDGAMFHLLIGAAEVEQATGGRVDQLSRLVGKIAELRDRGMLQVETLSQTAKRLSQVPAAVPQRSILRRAA